MSQLGFQECLCKRWKNIATLTHAHFAADHAFTVQITADPRRAHNSNLKTPKSAGNHFTLPVIPFANHRRKRRDYKSNTLALQNLLKPI